MPKKQSLKIDYNFIEDNDYSIIAINCQLKDYRLVHFLNKTLHFQFCKIDNLIKQFGKNFQSEIFSCFCFTQSDTLSTFYVIQNKNYSSSILIQELKQIDYFLIIKSSYYNALRIKEITNQIRKIEYVLMLQTINIQKANYFQYLLNDIEILELENQKKQSDMVKNKKQKLCKKK